MTEEAPLDLPLTVFGGTEDRLVSAAILHSWQKQTTGSFQLQQLPGHHFFLDSARSELLSRIDELRQEIVPRDLHG